MAGENALQIVFFLGNDTSFLSAVRIQPVLNSTSGWIVKGRGSNHSPEIIKTKS
jgi:hypothetical protein